ncbi:MAG: hypothetical protein H7263_09505 [Candidatus Sericytochromatia bacterium]|nr:hypothetical protein [Candidatus Sericytochromatia bacterium]
MQKSPFNQREVDLSIELNKKEGLWKPKSGDWFLDLNSVRVLYNGEYVQSISLCLVLDEDGRSFSFLELMIDGEENGNRMKKSLSFEEIGTMSQMSWMPSISDCIKIIDEQGDYKFLSLAKQDLMCKVSAVRVSDKKIFSITSVTELESFYSFIIGL